MCMCVCYFNAFHNCFDKRNCVFNTAPSRSLKRQPGMLWNRWQINWPDVNFNENISKIHCIHDRMWLNYASKMNGRKFNKKNSSCSFVRYSIETIGLNTLYMSHKSEQIRLLLLLCRSIESRYLSSFFRMNANAFGLLTLHCENGTNNHSIYCINQEERRNKKSQE